MSKRTIPVMLNSPHADNCPAVGGCGGWRPVQGKCNCGRFYPPRMVVFKCCGCGVEIMGRPDGFPRCPVPKCGILMDRAP